MSNAIKTRTKLIKMEQLTEKLRNHIGVFVTDSETEEYLKRIDQIMTSVRHWGVNQIGMSDDGRVGLDDQLISDLKRILELND